MSGEMKNCPMCGEEILAVAKKCKHCGEIIEAEIEKADPLFAAIIYFIVFTLLFIGAYAAIVDGLGFRPHRWISILMLFASVGGAIYAARFMAYRDPESKLSKVIANIGWGVCGLIGLMWIVTSFTEPNSTKASSQSNSVTNLSSANVTADPDKQILDRLWQVLISKEGSSTKFVNVKGRLLKKGTVPSSAVNSSIEARLPAYVGCFDRVVVMVGLGDTRQDMCIYLIDVVTTGTISYMQRGSEPKYFSAIESEMKKDGFVED